MTPFPEQQYRNFLKALLLVLLAITALWAVIDLTLLATTVATAPVTQEFEVVEGLGQTVRRNYQGVHFTTDENGFRRTYTPPAVPGEKRILVLGDSVTFGLGLVNGDDWPSQLEKYLRDHGVRATVLNAAVIGKMTGYMHTALDYYVSKQKPDFVIVQNTGNILAMSASNMKMAREFSVSPVEFLKAQFPSLASGSATPALHCQSTEDQATQNIKIVRVPRAIRAASEHSPVAAYGVSLIQKAHQVFTPPKTAPTPSKAPSASASPGTASASAVDPRCREYLLGEFSHMGSLIESARTKGVSLVLLKPTYTFNWGPEWMTDRLAKVKNAPAQFTEHPETLRKFVEALDFSFTQLATPTGTVLIDPIASYREQHVAPDDVLPYYSGDYTHYSVVGSRIAAEGVGAALLKAKLVEATETSPWKHPNETATADLRHRPFGNEARFKNILLVCTLLTILACTVGGPLLMPSGGLSQSSLLAPALGLYLMLCLACFAPEISAGTSRHPAYGWVAFAVGLFGLIALLIKNSRCSTKLLRTLGFLFTMSALAAAILLATASHRQTPHERRLETVAAWVEYGALHGQRPKTVDLQARMASDGISRPYMLPAVLESSESLLSPASPGIPLVLSRWFGITPHDSLLGTIAVAIAVLALASAHFLRPLLPSTIPVVAVLAGMTVFLSALASFKLPSFLGLFHLLGLLMLLLAIIRMPHHPYSALGIAFFAGIALLLMPYTLVLLLLLAASTLIGICYWQGKQVAKSAAPGLLVLVGMALAARVLFIDRPLGNVGLSLSHGAAYLGLPLYFW